MKPKLLWALGLMSGTSADGIDAALIHTDGEVINDFGPTLFKPYPEPLKNQILEAYGRPPGPEATSLEQAITHLHAEVVRELLNKTNLKAGIIGFHGQTVFHKPPRKHGEIGETHVLSDGPLLASLTSIPVVDQFRINDVTHGGQGAPFVPIFHQALAKDLPKPLAILNIGGVANVTWIGQRHEDLLAFDTGPGNGLMDDWVRKNTGLPWDVNGEIAAQGHVQHDLVTKWISHPYFSAKPPKALDRETFKACLEDIQSLRFEDGAATLTAFTVATVAQALKTFPKAPSLWLICGGGAHNKTLLNMIEEKVQAPTQKVSAQNWDGDALEAQAFGYLAVRSLRGLPLSFPGTTGVPYPMTGGRITQP
jgi:anhydro-N-acetylmuramic acid kinase